MKTALDKMMSPSSEQFLRTDIRDTFRKLLPELAASIVMATCITTALFCGDGENILMFCIAVFSAQALVQSALYAGTYLTNNAAGTIFAWFCIAASIPILSMLLSIAGVSSTLDESMAFTAAASTMFGLYLFYLTRTRVTFCLFAIWTLALSEMMDQAFQVMVIYLIGLGALAALLVMRCSASRIVMSYDFEIWEDSTSIDGKKSSPLQWQVAAVCMSVGAICLAIALAGALIAGWRHITAVGETGSTTGTSQIEENGTQTNGGAPAGESVEDDASQGAQPIDTQAEGADKPSAGAGQPDRQSGSQQGSRTPFAAALLIPLFLAMVCLVFPARLFLRRRARRSIEQEPIAADRAARIYLGILSRLKAAGIERDEAETPLEFLSGHVDDLVKLTEPAGVGIDEWTELNEIYEKARYAGLEVTDAELKACWRLYDALPLCTRNSTGWLDYLTGAFWGM